MSKKSMEFRLPLIKTAADVEALTHLTKEEKEMAVKSLKKIAPSDGWQMMGNDPELQAFWAMVERESIALLYPDFQVIPFSPMNLVTLAVAKRSGSDYQYGALGAFTAMQVKAYNKPETDLQKLPFIDLPDAGVWTEEESLSIKLALACIDLKIPEELFKQAVDTWGVKKTLRLISWIGVVYQWAILIEALGMRYVHEKMAITPIPPQAVEKVTESFQSIRPEMMKMWDNLCEFG